jgi:hypothetical protein
MKGMLTGPVTILNWSFPRADVSRELQSKQLALALRDEVVDLENAGIHAIQVDEPAIREGVSVVNVPSSLSILTVLSYRFVVLTGTPTLNGRLIRSSFLQPELLTGCKPTLTFATLTSETFSLPSSVLTLMSSLLRLLRVT